VAGSKILGDNRIKRGAVSEGVWSVKEPSLLKLICAKHRSNFAVPRHLIPPPVYLGVRVSPFISLICISYLYFETDHSLVS
jgi:hypothetical protein